MKSKSPYRDFDMEEITRAEASSYVVQIGNDLYCKDGDLVFTEAQAEKHYNSLLKSIKITLDKGTDRQKIAANKCLLGLRILPLRIH